MKATNAVARGSPSQIAVSFVILWTFAAFALISKPSGRTKTDFTLAAVDASAGPLTHAISTILAYDITQSSFKVYQPKGPIRRTLFSLSDQS
jgi:hypothetical protein